jgi:hypothetical protein
VPLVNLVVYVVLIFVRGDADENRFGANPAGASPR